jgi:BirA family transcriptional regulator, biotin operon repressor / biotin---[acetyl-CoA-carboxylase] ligase
MTTQQEIVRLFQERGEACLSGEEISRILGVTRSAVWKQIGLLRERGYRIEAHPAKGYRLIASPDSLLPTDVKAGLQTAVIGGEIVFFEETDSTNAQAHELAENGAAEGTVVIAESQSAGKGRLGRQWISPAGVNLYTSVILRPPIPPRFAPQLTFLSAVAVAWAIRDTCGLNARVKWPNDILLDGKKTAGLLNEMSAETEKVHYVILGIGVNLNMPREQFPPDLRYPATSVALELGEPVRRSVFARSLICHLDHLYRRYLAEGVAPILAEWEALFDLTGRLVEVGFEPNRIEGRVEGLDADGALLLRLENGTLEKILAGDVRPKS